MLEQSTFHKLVKEVQYCEDQFYLYFRMTPRIYYELFRLDGLRLEEKTLHSLFHQVILFHAFSNIC